MDSILVRGRKNDGKSYFIVDILKNIYTDKYFRNVEIWCICDSDVKDITLENLIKKEKWNGHCIVKANNKFILVCLGSPTEQKLTIDQIYSLYKKFLEKQKEIKDVNISLSIVAIRTKECSYYTDNNGNKAKYDTKGSLEKRGKILAEIQLRRELNMDNDQYDDDYQKNQEKVIEIIKSKI